MDIPGGIRGAEKTEAEAPAPYTVVESHAGRLAKIRGCIVNRGCWRIEVCLSDNQAYSLSSGFRFSIHPRLVKAAMCVWVISPHPRKSYGFWQDSVWMFVRSSTFLHEEESFEPLQLIPLLVQDLFSPPQTG